MSKLDYYNGALYKHQAKCLNINQGWIMVEFFELISSYWNKSKKDWEHNKHRLFTLFGFVIVAYLVLEFGSYIFTSRLNHARTVDEIRTKFMDKRVELASQFLEKFYILKETTRILLIEIKKEKYSPVRCEAEKKKLDLAKIESEWFVSGSSLRYFFGDEITNEFIDFTHWFDKNDENCFSDIFDPENTIDKKVFSLRNKMWKKMYPPEYVESLR